MDVILAPNHVQAMFHIRELDLNPRKCIIVTGEHDLHKVMGLRLKPKQVHEYNGGAGYIAWKEIQIRMREEP
jgi:hypothetical protein